MSKTENFMRQLHEQASGGDEAKRRKDRAIMRVLGSWIERRTPEYLKATEDGMTDAEYLGAKAKKACVDQSTAKEMAEKILGKWYDSGSVSEEMMPEFNAAYHDAEEEEWWRDKYFGNIG